MALVRSGRVSRCRLWSVWWCLCLWCGVVGVSVALLVVFWSLVLSGVGVVSSVALWVFWCAVAVLCCLWVWCWVFSGGLWLCLSLWWSGLLCGCLLWSGGVVSLVVFSSGVWSSGGVGSGGINRHTKRECHR